jgi:hypothetical protein
MSCELVYTRHEKRTQRSSRNYWGLSGRIHLQIHREVVLSISVVSGKNF